MRISRIIVEMTVEKTRMSPNRDADRRE